MFHFTLSWFGNRFRLLFLQDGIDIFLVKLIPGSGSSIDDDGEEARDDIEDDPPGSDMVGDVEGFGFEAFFAELDSVVAFGFEFDPDGSFAHRVSVDIDLGALRVGVEIDLAGITLEQGRAARKGEAEHHGESD